MVANLIKRGSITRTSRIEGAPLVPYVWPNRYRLQPWLQIPRGWSGSNLEWIVWWYLSIYGIDPNRRKLVPNRDFYWQKAQTAPGLFIAQEVSNNRFRIAGGLAGMKVSWQVTGIRQDPFANAHRLQVEEVKPEKERGFFLHPLEHGQPEEKSIEWARHPELMQDNKQRREQPRNQSPPQR